METDLIKQLLQKLFGNKELVSSSEIEDLIDTAYRECNMLVEQKPVPDFIIDEYLELAMGDCTPTDLALWRSKKYEQLYDAINEKFFRTFFNVRESLASFEYEEFWWLTNYFMIHHNAWFSKMEDVFAEKVLQKTKARGMAPGMFMPRVIEE